MAWSLLLSAASLWLSRPAICAPTATGFALNRYQPSEAGSDWFKNESLDLRGEARPSLALTADFSDRPLVVLDAGGQEVVAVVGHQFFYHLSTSLVLAERLRLSASLPVLLHSQGGSGELATLGGVNDVLLSSRDGAGIGDARFGLDLRVAGQYGEPFVLALGARVHAATGDEEVFSSDGVARLESRLAWAGEIGPIAYAGQVGGVFHVERDDYAGVPFGTDLTGALAVGVRFADRRVIIGPEIAASTVISDSGSGFLKRESTPVELTLSGRVLLGDSIRLGLGGGSGLTQGLGSPRYRVLASVTWLPAIIEPSWVPPATPRWPARPPASDLDGDGLADALDVCPQLPGPARPTDPARSGCPDPPDADADGIADFADACPHEAGLASRDARRHGCRPLDRDSDGIVDEVDACPDQPGVLNAVPGLSGCPADTDSDGIADAEDACPRRAGPVHADPRKRGCPRVRVVAGSIAITERVEFATASSTLLDGSHDLLAAVAQSLRQHSEIRLIRVEGHTDGRGSPRFNRELSQRRAAAVVRWLVVEGGVAPERLTSQGYGSQRPIDTNDTEAGRQNNRRVEFKILRQDKVLSDPVGGRTAPGRSQLEAVEK